MPDINKLYMSKKNKGVLSQLKKLIRNRLLTGFLVILPIYVTFFVVKFLFGFVGTEFLPILKKFLKSESSLPDAVLHPILIAVGIFITFVVLYIIGFFASNFLGRKIISFYESIISNTPVIKGIYSSTKQVIHTFSASDGKSFKKVVLVEYPKKGTSVFGFVTGSITNKVNNTLVSVFIPTTPNPTSGFLIYLSKDDIMDTNLAVEEAIKLIISGGILVPDGMDFQVAENKTRKVERIETF